MRSTLWLTLVAYLAASATPVTAQEKTETTFNSLGLGLGAAPPLSVHGAQFVEPPLCFETAFVAEPIRCGGQNENSLRVDGERLQLDTTSRPRMAPSRRSTLTGGLIGFGIGGVLGMTVGQEACLGEPRWHCLKVGVSFAAIGALIGWLHR